MIDLANSKLFTPSTDPDSNITSYILTTKVAPLQQGFYFVNTSLTNDERYLWFYCAFPPAQRILGVVDFQTDEVRCFPETEFDDASPYLDPVTGHIVWAMGKSLWQRGPGKDDQTTCINTMPDDIIGARWIKKLATHLTRTADGKAFFIDMQCGLQHIFGTLPINGSDFELWHRFDRCYNHAQASPIDPKVILFAQEFHSDQVTGLVHPVTDRVWTMRKGQPSRPVSPQPRLASHEWWDPDGKHAWCVRENDTIKMNIETGHAETIRLPHLCWHCHLSQDGSLIVGDTHFTGFMRGTESAVNFTNRNTAKTIRIVKNPAKRDYIGKNYHIDPHPRFCCDDKYIVYTTTVRGQVDIAITPTQKLLDRTS